MIYKYSMLHWVTVYIDILKMDVPFLFLDHFSLS